MMNNHDTRISPSGSVADFDEFRDEKLVFEISTYQENFGNKIAERLHGNCPGGDLLGFSYPIVLQVCRKFFDLF